MQPGNIEENKKQLFDAIKGGMDPAVDAIIKAAGTNPDQPIILTYKEFSRYIYMAAAAAAQAVMQTMKKTMEAQEDSIKEYMALEFVEDFKKLDKCMAIAGDVAKLKERVNMAFKYLDKHDKLLVPDDDSDR